MLLRGVRLAARFSRIERLPSLTGMTWIAENSSELLQENSSARE